MSTERNTSGVFPSLQQQRDNFNNGNQGNRDTKKSVVALVTSLAIVTT
jgi:hypothetical protein